MKRLIGEFHWTPPAWLQGSSGRRLAYAGLMLTLMAAGGYAALRFLDARPGPPRIVADITAPGITPIIDGVPRPEPLFIDFRVVAGADLQQDTPGSVARIDLLDKVITQDIALEPALPGQWRWDSGSRLVFTPAQDWPPGQQFTVTHEAALFAPQLELASRKSRFVTPPFAAGVDAVEYYQDPVQRGLRKVVASLEFSHPVERSSLERQTRLFIAKTADAPVESAQAVGFEIQYDEHGRKAYVHSVPIAIAPQESFVTLRVEKGLKAASGPARFDEALEQDVRIPDSASYFRVSSVQALIARNEENEPVQHLTLEFTDDVEAGALQQKLRAWILPDTITVNGKTTNNKRWRGPREVTPDVLAQAQKFAVTVNPVEGGSSAVHSAAIDVPEGSSLYIAVAQGLRSAADFELTLPFEAVLSAPRYPKEATIAQSGAVLALTGTHQLTLISRGVRTLKVDIGRLIDGQVNHLASQTGGDITNPYFKSYAFGPDNLTERFTRFIDVNEQHPRKANFASLDLSDLLAGGGYYFVTVQGWDRARKHAVGDSDSRFVLITDLGLLVKTSADSSQDVFVHSIASGKPLGGVKISLLGKNGLPLVERTTRADGRAVLPSTRGYEREKEPTVIVASTGPDSVFMPYARGERQLQYSRYDVGGQYQQAENAQHQLTALVFNDRGLYRPGDTVNLGVVVKRRDWRTLDRLPLLLSVYDPRGQLALEQQVRLPADGFFDRQFTTTADSPTGDYNATLFVLDERGRRQALGSSSFRVEEFLPDRLRISASLPQQSTSAWLKPADLAVQVSLQNLFGTPAQARRVTGRLRLTPSTMRISGFENFVFDDPLREPGSPLQAVTIDLPATSTDASGIATLPLPLAQYDDGIYRAVVFTEGFEEDGGRSVSAEASAMLSPLDSLVGYRTNSGLEYLPRGSVHQVEFVAVNSSGEPIALDDLIAERVEERFVSALVKRANGTWGYQSVRRELPVGSNALDLAAGGSSVTLDTQTPGNFILKLRNPGGRVVSRVRYTVAGERNIAGNLERNAELDLVMNGSSFAPGDDITLEITAPYSGTGLITVERDRVYTHRWFTTSTTTTVQSITVPAGLEGNAYVNVAFIRALDSPEVLVSPLSYAVAPFAINRDDRTVSVELDVPERVRPGQDLEIRYRTSRPSRMVLYAVDEGITQVARYSMPDPVNHFLPKMALQVSTFQMADLILPEFDMYVRRAAPGGGEANRLIGSNLNPFRRRSEAPVVYWSGIIDAGDEGGTVRYRVPDYFNGELRIMAIAVADSAVGRQQRSTTVRGPFVISPGVLTAAAPGDEFDVTAGLSNNVEGSGAAARVSLSLTASEHLQIIGERTQTIIVAEGQETRAAFRVRALDRPGAATLTFRAEMQAHTSTRSASLSIRPSVPFVTTVQSGSGSADPLTVTLERTLYEAFAEQPAAASASPLVLADGLMQYLADFPHGCAEQLVSKAFPQIGFLGSADSSVDEAGIRDVFASTVQRLRSRQTPQGGFRFWPGTGQPQAFATVYIAHFLTDAKELGLAVPQDMQRQALAFLRQVAGNPASTLQEARLRSYAIYVLTRNGDITTNALVNLHRGLEASHADTWRADITGSYMAASYALLQQVDAGRALIGAYDLRQRNEMHHDFDTTLGRNAQHLYLVARHFPQRLETIGATVVEALGDAVMRNRFNTLSSAYTVLALNAYTRSTGTGEALPQLKMLNAESGKPLASASSFTRATVPVGTAAVTIAGGGDTRVYYSLAQSGFDRQPPDSARADGLEIFREYLNGDGEPVTSARLGDSLFVRLRVRSTGQPRTNVAVIDLLPGGFEVEADSIRDGGGWSADYRDVREDRVVIYGSFDDRITDIEYRVRATSAGDFVIPAAYASSMYDRSLQARSRPGRFSVTRTP